MRGILFGLLLSNLLYLGWGVLVARQQPPVTESEIPPAAGMSVVLLAEASPADLRYFPTQSPGAATGSDAPGLAVEDAASDVEGYCAEIGPFESQQDADGFIGTNADRFAMATEVRSTPAPPDYRVYLPPLVSRELAASTMTALREAFAANNLSIDSFLITSGELENGIALGLFAEQRNALNVQAQLERLGYRVVIAEQEKVREEVWILVSGMESKADFDRHWAEIQLSRSYIRAGEKLCETIAHGL